MKNAPFKSLLISIVVTFGVGGCLEIYPIKPSELKDKVSTIPKDSCIAPPIERNIIGKWHYESTYNIWSTSNSIVTTRGNIEFGADGVIADPDSLFENHPDGVFTIIKKTYNARVVDPGGYGVVGEVFAVFLHTTTGQQQINFFNVVQNECNLIHLRVNESSQNRIGFILTRQ